MIGSLSSVKVGLSPLAKFTKPVSGTYKNLGEKVRDIMGVLSLRQAAIKTAGQLSPYTIMRLADGDRIGADKLDAFARAFSKHPNELRVLADYPLIADSPEEAGKSQLGPEDTELLKYMADPQIRKIVRYAAGMPSETKGVALETVRALAVAAGIEIVDDKYQNAAELAEDRAKRTTHGARTED